MHVEDGKLVVYYDPTGVEIWDKTLDKSELTDLREGWKAALADEDEMEREYAEAIASGNYETVGEETYA